MAAAPKTALVCARPASVSEREIEETSREPAATVPAVPSPFRICAEAKTLTVLISNVAERKSLVCLFSQLSIGADQIEARSAAAIIKSPRVIITEPPMVRRVTNLLGFLDNHWRAVPANIPQLPSEIRATRAKIAPNRRS